jgi:hypothetical protein
MPNAVRGLIGLHVGLLALLLAATATATPETPQFRPVGVGDGLPSSTIAALALDRDGFLWIGTRDGLARYDGVGYRIYRHVPGDPASLPGNSVQALYVDAHNRLWIGVESEGLAMLGPDRAGFRHIDQASQPLLKSDDVCGLAPTAVACIDWMQRGAGRDFSPTPPRPRACPRLMSRRSPSTAPARCGWARPMAWPAGRRAASNAWRPGSWPATRSTA